MTSWKRPTDAARSIPVRPGTYRTYEIDPADGGRSPPISEVQRIARRYRVSWPWLATGQGTPTTNVEADGSSHPAEGLAKRARDVPAEKQDDAIKAAMSVLESYIPRAS